MRINIRYGCVILRHYLDLENGNLFMALGRYNGSRGQSAYPDAVFAAWKRWRFQPSDVASPHHLFPSTDRSSAARPLD